MIAVPHSCSRHSRLVEPHFPFSRLAKSSRVRRRHIPSRNSRQVRYSLPDSSHGSKTRKQDRIRMDSFQLTCRIPWSGFCNNKTPGKRCPICHVKLVSYHSGFWQIHVRLYSIAPSASFKPRIRCRSGPVFQDSDFIIIVVFVVVS